MASRPNLATRNALDARVRRPVTFCFLDLADGPVRVTDGPYDVTFSGTGDADLDGFTFQAVDSKVVGVSVVKAKEGGSDGVSLTLRGLMGVDSDTLNTIGNKANWQGRDARLWKGMLDPDTAQLIGVWAFYTGYMSVPKIVGDQRSQTIVLNLESYLAYFGQASNRTYLDQQLYDPGDRSAELSIAIANGANRRR